MKGKKGKEGVRRRGECELARGSSATLRSFFSLSSLRGEVATLKEVDTAGVLTVTSAGGGGAGAEAGGGTLSRGGEAPSMSLPQPPQNLPFSLTLPQ